MEDEKESTTREQVRNDRQEERISNKQTREKEEAKNENKDATDKPRHQCCFVRVASWIAD